MRQITHLATAIAVALSSSAFAQNASDQKIKDWAKMREKAIPATELLASDVRNFANPVGQTDKLILNKEGTAIQYVTFDVPYPYSFYTGEDGFVSYDSVDVEDGAYGGVELMISDANVSLPRDQLKLTRGEARGRLVDRLIGSDLRFSDGETREVEDMLIDPESGRVTHYVVQMNTESLFDEQSRTIRVTNVKIGNDGTLTANMPLADVEKSQDYDPDFL